MINSSNWKYFDFLRIFDMRKGFYNKKPEPSGLGTIPFIGATDKNNGVTDYFTLEEIEAASKTGKDKNHPLKDKIFPPNALCVTNNGSVGFAYFQKDKFTCSHDVNPLYKLGEDFNEYTALFVATVIMYDRYRWGYGRKWRPERMKSSRLKLPICRDSHGKPILDQDKKYSDEGYIPDWKYMENSIKKIWQIPVLGGKKDTYSIYKNLNKQKFKISEICSDITKAKSHYKVDLIFSKTPKPGWIKFVSRTELNNSVDGWVKREPGLSTHPGNAIVIGDTTATISYQADEFVAGEHIIVLRADWLNKLTGNYVVSLLRQEKYRYSYGRAFNQDLVKSTEIMLPIDSEDKPDWAAIEVFMKDLIFAENME